MNDKHEWRNKVREVKAGYVGSSAKFCRAGFYGINLLLFRGITVT